MKKIYEKPTVEVVDVELESLLTTVSGETDNAVVDPDTEIGEGGSDSKEHNGFWE